ncbi:MAG: Gfo/Idh/MocA family protein [Verrucomicrobiales bacterium]
MNSVSFSPTPYSRRRFLSTSAAALGVAPMALIRADEESPNEQIAIGIIGCGGMGLGNMKNFLNIKGVRVVAVCDVDRRMMQKAKRTVDEFYENEDCKMYEVYRDLLGHPELDAVSVATPDHWHARIGIDAAEAGMDIYGEKPLTWGLAEGRALVDAIGRNQCIWQTGSWQRSKGEFRRFKALIENDTIGELERFECGLPSGYGRRGKSQGNQVPSHLDWEAYCGPAGEFGYDARIHPFNWRWIHHFGGGQLLDWVGHHVDIALWTLGLDHTGPEKVKGSGKLGEHDLFDAYVDYTFEGTFADGPKIEVRSDFQGTRFTGKHGWIYVNRGKLEASDREMLRNLPDDFETKTPSHHQNFIDCVRSRKTPQSDAEGAHRAASFGQLALAAMDHGEEVRWDPAQEQVLGNPKLAKHPRLGSRL